MKKTWVGVVLLPLAVALIAIALVGGKTTQARETAHQPSSVEVAQTTDPAEVFECFRLDVPQGQQGADPKVLVRLVTDNFGGKLVRVRRLVAMCELANKFPPPGLGIPDETWAPKSTRIFACYQIERGNDPNDPFILHTTNFGDDRVWVRASRLMCEEASKTRFDAAGQPSTVGDPTGQIWQCFNLNQSKNIFQKKRLVTNNFGRDDVLIIRGVQLCEEAMKLRKIDGHIVESGEATGKVLECFAQESKLDPKVKVRLNTRNFGNVDAVVRRAWTMCEPAWKTPLYELPNDREDPGGILAPIGILTDG